MLVFIDLYGLILTCIQLYAILYSGTRECILFRQMPLALGIIPGYILSHGRGSPKQYTSENKGSWTHTRQLICSTLRIPASYEAICCFKVLVGDPEIIPDVYFCINRILCTESKNMSVPWPISEFSSTAIGVYYVMLHYVLLCDLSRKPFLSNNTDIVCYLRPRKACIKSPTSRSHFVERTNACCRTGGHGELM